MQQTLPSIEQRLASVRSRIEAACARAQRDPATVCLIGASKQVDPVVLKDAIACGLTDLGENVVQYALLRKQGLGETASAARWHMIGHLQTNKVRAALAIFDVVQSVDSLRLAHEISRRASAPVHVLLEVNVATEATKYGFLPHEVAAAIAEISTLPNFEVEGLMTVAPAVPDPELVRPVFRELRELARAYGLSELSMGMSDDFETAIEEGATMVRIGRAIFGERI